MTTRRRFLGSAVALALAGCSAGETKDEKEVEVNPAEDLMREHGVLNRILLIYEDQAGRLERSEDANPDDLARSAGIVRSFIEDYHGKLEEAHIFPRFEKAGKHVELVRTLRAQHEAGRRVTDEVKRLATPAGVKGERAKLAASLRAFVRMYRPHEAREDTVVFPALHELVTPREWDELGDKFEDREHELFGKEGFEGIVAQVAAIEKTLGLDDLGRFTPG